MVSGQIFSDQKLSANIDPLFTVCCHPFHNFSAGQLQLIHKQTKHGWFHADSLLLILRGAYS